MDVLFFWVVNSDKCKSTQKTPQKILDVLRIEPKASRKGLAKRLNTTEDSTKWYLETMKKENKIRRIGAAITLLCPLF